MEALFGSQHAPGAMALTLRGAYFTYACSVKNVYKRGGATQSHMVTAETNQIAGIPAQPQWRLLDAEVIYGSLD